MVASLLFITLKNVHPSSEYHSGKQVMPYFVSQPISLLCSDVIQYY